EATARLSATAPGDPMLAAVLPGPATFAAVDPHTGEGADGLERAGETVLVAVKRFVEAGTSLVVFVEEIPPPEPLLDAWRSAVTPLVNVTRFHQALPVMVFSETAGAPAAGSVAALPPTLGLCVPVGAAVPGPPTRVRGTALPPE